MRCPLDAQEKLGANVDMCNFVSAKNFFQKHDYAKNRCFWTSQALEVGIRTL